MNPAMRPDSVQPLEQPASGDALSLFTYEPEGSNVVPAPPKAPGAVSLDRIVDAAPLRFVEGIAVVQALSSAIREKGGINAGMLDLRGVFINEGGDLVALTPPGAEPAAPELARLLHRLVPAEATPPVARLFIDRWTSGTSTDLGAFASEIAYFARPNGRELLTALHARCADAPGAPPQLGAAPVVVPAMRVVEKAKAEEPEKPAPRRPSWLQSHKRHLFAATVAVAVTALVTGLTTWFWPSKAAVAAQGPVPTATETTLTATPPPAETASGERNEGRTNSAPVKSPPSRPTSQPRAAAPAGRSVIVAPSAPAPLPKRPQQDGIDQVATAPSLPESAPVAAAVPSRAVPDMRIYSSADSGIEPPRLRSAEILEGLIAGFPTKTNAVEVFVDRAGKVERVRMQGALQRIPDIVILSRVKEWVFDPATKDGAAVRYRMILTWDVTP
jgi:hypothetical protein